MEPFYKCYDIIRISYYDSFEYRLYTDTSICIDTRPYIIIKHIYDTKINYHINSILVPISEELAIKSFYNIYPNNCDFLKKINLTHIL